MELLLIKLFITAHLRIMEGANDFYLAEKIVKYVILLSVLSVAFIMYGSSDTDT